MHQPIRLGLVAVALAVCAVASTAQIDPSDPFGTDRGGFDSGAPGDSFDVYGQGLPEGKIKARLIDPDTGKRVKGSSLRVFSFVSIGDEDHIGIELRKGCGGSYQVEIKAKNFPTAITPSNGGETLFEVKVPDVGKVSLPADTETLRFVPGEEVTLEVQEPGRKSNGKVIKPRLTIGGRRARVGKPGNFDPFENTATMQVRLPKKIATGDYTYEIKTRAGSSLGDGEFSFMNSNAKQNRIKNRGLQARYLLFDSVHVNRPKKSKKLNIGRKKISATASTGDGTLMIGGSKGNGSKTKGLSLLVPQGTPLEEGDSFFLEDDFNENADLSLGPDTFGDNNGAFLSVRVEAVNEGVAQLFIAGVLRRQDGSGDPVFLTPDSVFLHGRLTVDQGLPAPDE